VVTAEFIDIPTLWDSAVAVVPRKLTTEEAWEQFCRRHPQFVPRLAAMCFEERLRGSTRGSVKLQFETLRREWPDVRTNNNWTALAARKVMELYPDLDGYYMVKGGRG
jgi:hypothetical protein